MTDNERSSQPGATELRDAPILRTKGLLAEYTTGQAPSGEWFALGTVRGETFRLKEPAWLLVGMGPSREDAVANLADRLELEAARFSAA